jgi:malonyl-CoA/methylmalonyl-CoA synthetase
LLAGVPVVPVDPTSGERELQHIVRDSDPEIVLVGPARGFPGNSLLAGCSPSTSAPTPTLLRPSRPSRTPRRRR